MSARTISLVLFLVSLVAPSTVAHAGLTQLPPGAKKSDLDCALCHVEESWTHLREPLRFNHQKTAFPLEGQHKGVDCQSCHPGGSWEKQHDFAAASVLCVDCHADVHRGEMGGQCDRCHSTKGWSDEGSFRRMHDGTRLPLMGVHATLDCSACHAENRYPGLSAECSSCHWKEYLATRNPDHHAVNFGSDCASCHSLVTRNWTDNVSGYTQIHPFPLVGGHANHACSDCHLPGSSFSSLSSECVSCHLADFQGTTSPDHQSANFGTRCDVCHSVYHWTGVQYNHDATGFPLTGAHTSLECNDCHSAGYTGLSSDCVSCHRAAYDGATDPPHAASGFPLTCEICHSTSAWTPASFDHAEVTGYALTGAHSSLNCTDCHIDGNYTSTPTECYGCHSADFSGATDPPHDQATFGNDCSICHSTTAWSPATFDHGTVTGYALTGAHTSLACVDCHINGVYTDTPNQCIGCHSTDFENATDPPHDPASFGTDCAVCHTTTAWSPATFDHGTVTGWPLTGAHISVACNLCHVSGYTNTPTDCYSCHKSDYDATTNPNHASAGFPTSCQDCHNTTRWDDADFDHDGLYFPIYSGKHRGTWSSCADCHPNSASYAEFTCISCHEHNKSDTDSHHREVSGYSYTSSACYNCHPDGRAEDDAPLRKDKPMRGIE